MDANELTPIRQLLAADRFKEAREAIAAALLRHRDQPLLLAYQAALRMEFGEFDAAQDGLIDAAARAGQASDGEAQAFAEMWLGYLANRRKRPDEAVTHFEISAAIRDPSADLCAALCQTYVDLKQPDKAKAWGARSLAMRAAEATCPEAERVKRQRPRPFSPARRQHNVIAFSLFGGDPFYRECAVTIARSARGIFPEFTCRFYCSTEIPQNVNEALSRAGARVLVGGTRPDVARHPFSGAFWRFLPFDDPDVDMVLVRDVDSPFTFRERLAIDYWLASDAPFLTMRDSAQHTEPLMAGMWGGFTGLLPPLSPVMWKYIPSGSSKFVDQRFLRLFIWPRIREATLAIDSVYKLGRSVEYPADSRRPGALSVGAGWRRDEIVGGPAA
jgi:hypothetical protein